MLHNSNLQVHFSLDDCLSVSKCGCYLFLYIYIFPTSKFSYFKFSWINIVVKTGMTRKKREKFVKTLLKEMITSEYSFFEAKRRNFSTRHRNFLQPITMKMFHFLIKEHCAVFISLCLLYRAPRFNMCTSI